MIRVQTEDFDIGAEIAALKADRTDIGAIVTFTGTVRDQDETITEMTLEHYPGMTEAELARIEKEAHAHWPLLSVNSKPTITLPSLYCAAPAISVRARTLKPLPREKTATNSIPRAMAPWDPAACCCPNR